MQHIDVLKIAEAFFEEKSALKCLTAVSCRMASLEHDVLNEEKYLS